MSMDCKFYVSYEAARLLKEKGYDEVISTFYNEDGLLLEVVAYYNLVFLAIEELNDDHYPAITKAEAIDWLESKGMVAEAFYTSHHWFFSIIDFNVKQKIFADEYYSTRLEAEEAAIIKACEFL